MTTTARRVPRRPELETSARKPKRLLLLVDLVAALSAAALNDGEATAALEYMLAAGHVRFVGDEALAA